VVSTLVDSLVASGGGELDYSAVSTVYAKTGGRDPHPS
jgi:hypothetical protein